eukprot:TRINITY_DN129_c2_g1_i10.p2 TRINITY_DN129_c2_g1~~TRINITY_DN129_c2_g1_i10.p2  ORF type:complete len:237 (+),score=103.14 TRINITY_DN129_c2_g1_i10:67-777(+)
MSTSAPPQHFNVDDLETGGGKEPPMVFGDQRTVEAHISNVYSHLTGLMMMATVGAYFQLKSGLMVFYPMVFLCLGCLFYVMMGQNQTLRAAAFCAFGFFDGWTLGVLITSLHTPPSTLLTAILMTCGIFGSFTVAARYAKRRQYLYMGGILSSCLWALLIVSVANMFFRLPFFHAVSLYGGLVLFSFYVAYDTQLMIERAHHGELDPMGDAINLFIDFMAILKRILIILAENSGDN